MIQSALFGECLHRRTVIMPEKRGPHHARETCSDCHKFIRWVPSPETIAKRIRNSEILTAVSKLDNLTEWEREFVRDVSRRKNVSPKQQETIDLLRQKYFP